MKRISVKERKSITPIRVVVMISAKPNCLSAAMVSNVRVPPSLIASFRITVNVQGF